MEMKKVSGIFILLLLILTSCDGNRVYEENYAVGENGWALDDIKTFEIPITDTISPIKLMVNLRTTIDYPYSNIYLFIESDYPTGYHKLDTIELILAKPDGEWYGENSGTVVENQFVIAENGRFAKAGTYIFKLQHAMKDETLSEILDVGMRVETVN